MLLKLLKRIFPKDEVSEAEPDISETTKKAWIELERYKDVSQALKEEIERNHFSPYLIYDKEKKKTAINKMGKEEEKK